MRIEGQLRRQVEGPPTLARGPFAGRADRLQHAAIERAAVAAVGRIVHTIESLIGPQRESVGPDEEILAPGSDEGTILCEDHHRMLAPVEDVDAITGIDYNVGDLPEGPSLGQPGPVGQLFIHVVPAPKYRCHVWSPALVCLDRHSPRRPWPCARYG